jgi:pimeloyl-ACP methyl ester carboxylesterase
MPAGRQGPFPVVVLVHGFSSNKEEVSRQLAHALTRVGFACIAMDMPGHGERPGKPRNMFGPDRQAAYENVVHAVKDVRQTMDLAETRRDLDTSSGIFLAGYSMGSWIGTLAGAADRRVKAMVLMVAGSAATAAKELEEEGPGIKERLDLVHHFAVLRHNLAIAKFAPRPVLMLNGKKDPMVPPERTKVLFEAAGNPKEQRWYDSGHLLPFEAHRDAAAWLAKQVKHAS